MVTMQSKPPTVCQMNELFIKFELVINIEQMRVEPFDEPINLVSEMHLLYKS